MSISLKSSLALAALLTGISYAGVQASAADLGGNCCADLEERIAELEATTARKGNRKVKLEVSGHVNEALLIWDDGVETGSGVYTNDNSRTRFRFKGTGKIDADTSAGYLLEVGVRGARSNRFNQENQDGCFQAVPVGANSVNQCGLDVRHSVWFIDSKKYGKLWVGLTGGAGENVTEVNLAESREVMKYSDQEDTGLGLYGRTTTGQRLANFSSTSGRSGLQWRQLIRGGGDQPGEGRRWNMVRYDTPEIFGFTGIVNYGEDDVFEAGLRYKGDFSGFKIAGAFAYGKNTEGPLSPVQGDTVPGFQCLGNNLDGPNVVGDGPDTECQQYGGSVSVMHTESGLYGNFAAGLLQDEAIKTDEGYAGNAAGVAPDIDSWFYAFEVGIERKWNELGKTTIFGQYYHNEGGSQDRGIGIVSNAPNCPWDNVSASSSNCRAVNLGDIQSSEIRSFGVGVVQGIDAAAMSLYVTYRHYEGEVTGITTGGVVTATDLDNLDVVMTGGIIRF